MLLSVLTLTITSVCLIVAIYGSEDDINVFGYLFFSYLFLYIFETVNSVFMLVVATSFSAYYVLRAEKDRADSLYKKQEYEDILRSHIVGADTSPARSTARLSMDLDSDNILETIREEFHLERRPSNLAIN